MTSTSDALMDQATFGEHAERHRRELHVHCYRMLGSFEESEELVQETFLRAWRRRETFEGRSSVRAWLYKIATNACLDALDKRPRTASESGEVLWLQPYPDELLAELPADEPGPEDAVASKETIELAFLAAVQHLPPLQRAVFVLRDVLGFSARETAGLLETSVASVTSAVQRARETMRSHLPERRLEWAQGTDANGAERELLDRYVRASEEADVEALKETLHDDLTFWMPPQPGLWRGRDTVVDAWIEGGFGSESFGSLRCHVTRANHQPAVANYVRKPGDDRHVPMALDVLRIAEGRVIEIVTFDDPMFSLFDVPKSLG
jgi:RNA polymerase sigma-70 factor (ECF subfamily)